MLKRNALTVTVAHRRLMRAWDHGLGKAVGLLGLLACLALLGALLAAAVPKFWGYNSYVIYTSSMEPTIGVGSLVVAKPVAVADLQVGDVIVFQVPGNTPR